MTLCSVCKLWYNAHAEEMAKIYDPDGFQLVVRGGRPKPVASSYIPTCEGGDPPSKDIVVAIQRAMDTSGLIQFAALVSKLLQTVTCDDIVCYGIGRFGTCFIASQQLALLLHIASAKGAKSVIVYDPLLSLQEKAALKELSCINIEHNELCQRRVQAHTLFYMPHCGQTMYNNLLWANWSPQDLSRLALIGNSFQSYMERVPHRELREKAPFIFKLCVRGVISIGSFHNADMLGLIQMMKCCQEWPLPPYIEPTVFNDLSLHTFPLDKLISAPSGTWTSLPPPPPCPSDPEIISRTVFHDP